MKLAGAPGGWTWETVGPRGNTRDAALRPGGKQAATLSEDGTVRLWETATGKLIAAVPVGPSVSRLGWLPNGKTLACHGWRGRLLLVDADSARIVAERDLEHRCDRIAWAPDGKSVAIDAYRDATHVYRLPDWKYKTRLETYECSGLLFADGQRLVARFKDRPDPFGSARGRDREKVYVFNIETRKPEHLLWDSTRGPFAVSPDGRFLAADGRLIPLDKGKREGPGANLSRGGRIVWARDSKSLLLWQFADRHGTDVFRVGLDGKKLKRWSTEAHPLDGRFGQEAVGETAGGAPVAITGGWRFHGFWRAGGKEVSAAQVHPPALAMFSPDGNRLAVVVPGGIRVLSAATLEVKSKSDWDDGEVGTLKGWTRDGKYLVAEKAVLDARTLKVVERREEGPWDREVVWRSPDGKWLAGVRKSPESDPEVRIEKTKDGPAHAKYELDNRAWSPRSDMLLLEGKLYRTDGKVVRSRYAWPPACFSPDGKRFASLLEGQLRIIDTGTGRELFAIPVPTSDPTSPLESSTVF